MDSIIESMTREIKEMQAEVESVKAEGTDVVKRPTEKAAEETKKEKPVEERRALKIEDENNNDVGAYRTNESINNTSAKSEAVKTRIIVVKPCKMETMEDSKEQKVGFAANGAIILHQIEEIPKMTKMTRMLEWIARASYSVPIHEYDVINYDVTPEVVDDDFELGDEACLYNLKEQIIKERNRPRRRVKKTAKKKAIKEPTEAQEEISPPAMNNPIILVDNVESSLAQKDNMKSSPTQKHNVESNPCQKDNVEAVSAQRMQKNEKKGVRARLVRRIQRLFSCFRPENAMMNE